MVLFYTELVKLVADGIITNVTPAQINGASIDLTLGRIIMVESPGVELLVDLSAKPRQYPRMKTLAIDDGYVMQPKEFLLASTEQKFFLPNDMCAHYFLNSSLARAGLDAALAMWCDPRWHDAELTLELTNSTRYHDLLLRPGMKCGQVVFHRGTPVPEEQSYAARGSYNGVEGPSVR